MYKILKISSLMVTFLAVTVSCVDRDYNDPELACGELITNRTVQEVYDQSTTTATKYEQDHIIEAYVTGSDDGGNFYKTISLMSLDGTRGFNIPLNVQTLFATYEPGRKVYVKLKDLYITRDNSTLNIGNKDPNYAGRVQRLFDYQVARVIQRSCTKVDENSFLKTNLTINDIKNDNYLHTLIELDNVQFDDNSMGKTFYDTTLPGIGGSEHQIIDQQGNSIMVRISAFAIFGGRAVPSGNGKIRGVLTKFGSTYQFMIRTAEDVKMTNERFEIDLFPPLGGTNLQFLGSFTENFESYTAGSVTTGQRIFPKYINDADKGGNYWYCNSFNNNKYLLMSAFSNNANFQFPINRVLFIMPVDFTAASSMSFKTQDRFNNGNVLKVYHSTDYVPLGNINNATLTDITSNFTIASGTTGSASQPFVNSGVYNFPASLTGNGFIIFEYLGGYSYNPVLTTNMHIDDIVVN